MQSTASLTALPVYQPGSSAPLQVHFALEPPVQRPVSPPAWLHEWAHDTDASGTLQIAHLPGAAGYLLRSLDFCDFHINPDAGTILVDPLSGLDPHTLEHLLIDQALPRLLAGQGQLMVHASLVRIGAHAALFVGRSGWGKSTLAGLLHRRGHAALCDDCALLELRDGLPFATPAYPGLRLYQDSIDQTFADVPTVTPVANYNSKQRVSDLSLPPEWWGPQSIRALYLLDDPEQAHDACTLTPLKPAASCMALVEHNFQLDPTDRGQAAQLLRQAAVLSQVVPASLLRYPRDFARQDELVGMLLNHFDQHTGDRA